jgi:hypothetical protein
MESNTAESRQLKKVLYGALSLHSSVFYPAATLGTLSLACLQNDDSSSNVALHTLLLMAFMDAIGLKNDPNLYSYGRPIGEG